ncbi:MAG: hypothetical protein QG671_1946 [Actinomycetota bacterium]|nr:hypothetical protein [Actinomycetota bacterium]
MTTDLPTLDADRSTATAEYHRTVHDVLGSVEPHIPELDSWVALPVRLAHDDAAGWYLEVGPYDLNRADIEVLRQSIAAYDAATTGRPEAQQ